MSQRTAVTIIVVWIMALVVLVGGGYFLIDYLNFQKEFGPLVDVCQGKRFEVTSTYWARPGIHPAVAVRKGSGGLQLDRSLIPREALPASLTETQVVLCLGPVQEVFIERCPYTTDRGPRPRVTNTVERYYYKQEARLVEVRTGRLVSVQSFTGKSPHYCHEKERFRNDERTLKLTGTQVSEDDIQRWAQSHLVIN